MKQTKILLAVLLICLLTVIFVACNVQGNTDVQGNQGNQDNTGDQGNQNQGDQDIPDHNGTVGLEFYPINDTEYAVSVGTAAQLEEIIIPSMYKGFPVTEIADGNGKKGSSFAYCENLKSITIPDGVTKIGNNAFYNCSGLSSVIFGENSQLTTIGDNAFYFCKNLTRMTISGGVTAIGKGAFDYCTELKDVYYTGNVADWCGISFDSYKSNPIFYADNFYIDGQLLTEVVIPDTVTEIKQYAFAGYSSLTSVVVPSSVTAFGKDAFAYSGGLIDFYYAGDIAGWCRMSFDTDSSNPIYCADNFYIDGKLLQGELVIPDNVTTIGTLAFAFCFDLTSIVILDGTTKIGSSAFYSCSNVTSIVIPDSVTTIGIGAFNSCDKLTDVYYTGDMAEWCSVAFNDNIANPMFYAENLYIDGNLIEDKLIIPEGVTSISKYAFYGCEMIEEVIIPDSVTKIGISAFSKCENLESITIPFIGSSKEDPGYNCFGYIFGAKSFSEQNDYVPTSLKNATITGGTSIPNYAFYSCYGLTSVTLGDSITTIDDNAFYYCAGLASVMFGENSQLTTICEGAFANCVSLTSIVIPDRVTTIGDYAFRYCSSLTSVTISNSVTDIGNNAFDSCYRLVEVYNKSNLNIVEGKTTYGDVAHYARNVYTEDGGSKLSTNEDGYIIYTDGENKILVDYRGKQTELVLPNGITEINKYAFYQRNGLTNVVIPDSVNAIGEYAFNGCYNLTSVIFGENSQLTTIGDGTFYYCQTLANVVIPDSVTAIGEYAFYRCDNLTSVIFGENSQLNTIDSYAFSDCTSLTSIVIPDGVTTIGTTAFASCTSLTDVYYTGTEEQWKAIIIGGNNTCLIDATIHYNYVVEG